MNEVRWDQEIDHDYRCIIKIKSLPIVYISIAFHGRLASDKGINYH